MKSIRPVKNPENVQFSHSWIYKSWSFCTCHLFHNLTFMVRKQCWYNAGITDDTFVSLFEEIQEMGLIFPSDQLSQVSFQRYICMNNTHTHTYKETQQNKHLSKRNISIYTQIDSFLIRTRYCTLNISHITLKQLLSLKVCEIGVKTLKLTAN